ncbi:thioredoxin [bacterium]|nr:thioredoxin [bacterium]
MKALFRLIWLLLVIAMISLTAFGVKRGEWKKVKINAEIICTSCIGLGK